MRSAALLLVGPAAATLLALPPSQTSGPNRQVLGEFDLSYSAEYVGSPVCAKCHTEHAEAQTEHHMALTATAIEKANYASWFSEEKLAAPIEWPSDTTGDIPEFRVVSDGVLLETPDGRRATAIAMVGSGSRGVTPIGAETGRRIRELRLSYSEMRGGWFVTPGSERTPDSLGHVKTVEETEECLACHATVSVWNENGVLDREDSVFGIQCERCHGPGSAHVEAVSRGDGNSRVVHPGRANGYQQVIFCSQCHRQPTDFEPLDVLGRAPTLARHAGAGLMMSACFRESPPESTISCTGCHDPHRNAAAPDSERYRLECLRCHDSPGNVHEYERVSTESNCVGCHMPTEKQGFHGMTFTDHWIRVPGAPPPLGSETENEDLDYLEILFRNSWEETDGREKRSRIALGLAEVLYGQQRINDAYHWVHESLRHAPKMQHRLKAAAMLREGGRLEEATEILKGAVERDPRLVRAHFDLGEIAREQRRFEEAERCYSRALELRPDFFEAQYHLGLTLFASDRFVEASRAFERALELPSESDSEPKSAEVRTALARSLAREGRSIDALTELRAVIRILPNAPFALSGAAWILATHPDAAVRDSPEAVRLAERAASITGYQHPEVLDTLAAAYAAAGDFETAVNAAERAIAVFENNGMEDRAHEVKARLTLYRSGRAFLALPVDPF